MPPITDPTLLEEIKRQQQAMAAQQIAPPTAPMPFPGALPLRNPPSVEKTGAEIPFIAPKAKADITQTEATTEKTLQDVAESKIKAENYKRAVGENRLYLQDTVDAIEKARGLVNKWTTGWGGLLKEIPGTDAAELDSTLSPVRSNTAFQRLQITRNLSPTGGSATGQTSDFEQKMLMNSIANVSELSKLKPQQLKDNLDKVELHYLRSFAAEEGLPSPTTLEEGRKLFGINVPMTAPTTEERSFTHESADVPPEYQAKETEFLHAHPPGTLTLDEYMAHRKEMDAPLNYRTDPSMAKSFVDDYNKGAKVTKIPPVIREKPGAGASAGMAAFANAAAGGIPEATTGPEGRKYFESLTSEHPGYAWPGEIAGSLVGMKGVEIPGRLGVRSIESLLGKKLFQEGSRTATKTLAKDAAVNAVYGGARGFAGSDEGQGFRGTGLGAGLGVAGALAGTTVSKGILPFTSKGFQAARDLVSANSLKAFNVENANRALKWIGQRVPRNIKPGPEMNDYIHTQLSNEYDALKPRIKGITDLQFNNALSAVKIGAKSTEQKKLAKLITDAVGEFRDAKGNYTGEGYVRASTRLRQLSDTWRNSSSIVEQDMAREAENARKQMQFLIQRKAPPELAQRLKAVERGWAHYARIGEASKAAMASGEGNYTPRQYIAAQGKLDFSKGKRAYIRGKSLDQPYAMAAEKVLGSSGAPKVGLGERFRVMSVVGGLSAPITFTHPIIGSAITAMSYGLYGQTTKRIVNDILIGKRPSALEREEVRRAIEDYVRHQASGGD